MKTKPKDMKFIFWQNCPHCKKKIEVYANDKKGELRKG
jgi:hypothetical protein